MSSVTAAASSYSDLDARTEFVLNRVAFLEAVTGVLQNEDAPENSQKVTVWRDNNYIPLIVRSIMDPNAEIYDHAIWATGNMLVSDDPQVAAATRSAITNEVLKRLVQLAGVPTLASTVRNGIHYLFSNLSHYEMPQFFTEAVGGALLQTVLTDKLVVMNRNAQKDFLETLKNVAKKNPSAIDDLVLIDALNDPNQSKNYSRLFDIIGSLAEQDSMISPLGVPALMLHFTKQLADDNNTRRHEMLWVLSNIMTEFNASTLFMDEFTELKSLVESIAWNELDADNEDANEVVGFEALFVLVNFVIGAKHMSEEFKKNLADDFELSSLFLACIGHDNPKVVAVAREGFNLISQIRSSFYPAPVESHCEETESDTEYEECEDGEDSDESEEEECEDIDTENDVVVTIENDVTLTTCEKPVPTASDLVLGARRGAESGAVRRVVSLLVNSPVGEWIEVPSDWTLTIADLTTIQHLGYIIKDGYVGINPEIYNTY